MASLLEKTKIKIDIMNVYFLVLFMCFPAFSCIENMEKKQIPVQNNQTKNFVQEAQIDTLEYLILSESKIDGEQQAIVMLTQDLDTFIKFLIVKIDNNVLHSQALPSPDDYSGFAINWVKKTDIGFSLSIEHGTRYYYEQEFLFELKEGSMSLVLIKTKSFDKFNSSESVTFKHVTKSVNVPIKEFDIRSHIE